MRQEGTGSPSRGGLGRGLDALIPRTGGSIREVEVTLIRPNPAQPRLYFEQAALEELAASIREHGVLQPLIVSRTLEGYTLIAGERRLRAARLAGRNTVPVVVKEATPEDALTLALVENLQRADLTPLEEATAYRELIEAHHLTQDQVAARVGRSRASVTNRLRLLSLPPHAAGLLAEGAITEGHARALLGCPDATLMDALADRIVREGLSVRQVEELVRRAQAAADAPTPGDQPDHGRAPSIIEERLQNALGTRVQILKSRRGGRVVVHYYDDEQLAGIVEAMLGQDRE
jgi:ParB family transcriptional regulator, chromosome partitioning protein